MRYVSLLLLCGVLSSCGSAWETTNFDLESDGEVCLVPSDAPFSDPIEFDSNTAIDIRAVFDACASSSCSRIDDSRLSAEQDGMTFTISASLTAGYAAGNQPCTDDCGNLAATETVGPLAEGTYTFQHSRGSTTLTIPSSVASNEWPMGVCF